MAITPEGEEMKQVRVREGMTQERFSHIIGRHRTRINDYETGTHLVPGPVALLVKYIERYGLLDANPDKKQCDCTYCTLLRSAKVFADACPLKQPKPLSTYMRKKAERDAAAKVDALSLTD